MLGCMPVLAHRSLCSVMFQFCHWGSLTTRQFYNSPFGAIYIDHTSCQVQALNASFPYTTLFLSPQLILYFLPLQFDFFHVDAEFTLFLYTFDTKC